jgi:DNA-binding Lrp family transcriptional regulator
MYGVKLDKKDVEILRELQKDCRQTTKKLARKLQLPVTTAYSKITRMEGLGVIKAYRAVADGKKLGRPVTAVLLVSFEYHTPERRSLLSQRDTAERIARFPEVQEVHLITGDWDIIVKVRAESVESLGNFVIDKLRTVEGVKKTLSLLVYDTKKETSEIYV